MSREEVDVVAIKNSNPDLRGAHLWSFLQIFGVPNAHGEFFGKYAGYESYLWSGCGGSVEYYFDRRNICVCDSAAEFISMFKN